MYNCYVLKYLVNVMCFKVMLEKMVTVAIIEPDVVALNKLDEILEKVC